MATPSIWPVQCPQQVMSLDPQRTIAELKELRETMVAMLKANGPPPSGKFADFAVLEPVREYKARHASTLLTFDAVVDALGQIAAKQVAAA